MIGKQIELARCIIVKADFTPRRMRRGITIIELMVVVSVLGLLLALLLPAVQSARESARRTKCLNNLHQQGVAMLHFEQSKGRLPASGQGTDPTKNPPATALELHSAFTRMVTFIEEQYLTDAMNLDFAYNDAACPKNQVAAKVVVPIFLCPTNPFRVPDPNGYGLTDYMPTAYTDIDPLSGMQNPATRMNGALGLVGTPLAAIRDGTSRTIAIVEDSGRNYESDSPFTTSLYPDPIYSGGTAPVWNGTAQVTYLQWLAAHNLSSGGLPPGETPTLSGHRVMNRWADPASAGGVSGQPNSVVGTLINPINGNATPLGGPPVCPWSKTNCGPNEETWSWHPGGANVLMCDGSTRFISITIQPQVLRKLVTIDELLPFGDNDVPD